MYAAAGDDTHNVDRPCLTDRRGVGGQFLQWNGGLGRPAVGTRMRGHEPGWVPGDVAPAVLGDGAPLVEFEMMTWPEVKKAIADGKTTALFYTGGTEQRGPQNVNGGHTLMARATVRAIALKLGKDAVVFVGGSAERHNSGALLTTSAGAAFELVAVADGADSFGMAAIGRPSSSGKARTSACAASGVFMTIAAAPRRRRRIPAISSRRWSAVV